MTNKRSRFLGLALTGFLVAGCGGKNPALIATTSDLKVSPQPSSAPYVINEDPPGTLDGINDPAVHPGSLPGQRFALPHSMAALGDSISAGFLANLKRGDYLYSTQLWNELQLASDLYRDSAHPLDALEKKGWSWTTGLDSGDQVKSHAYRLKKMRSGLKVYNAAVSGSEAKDLLNDQLDKVLKWSRDKLGQGAPDYVTIMVGANDICAPKNSGMTTTQKYQDRVGQIVDTLLASEAKTRVLLSSIPNLEPLRKVARNARAFVGRTFTCEDVWKALEVCPNVTLNDDSSDRKQIAQRVVEYNTALKSIATQYAKKYGDRVRYAGAVYDYDLTINDLSIDCFHPNPGSQNTIAERSFKAGWWNADWKDYKSSHYNE